MAFGLVVLLGVGCTGGTAAPSDDAPSPAPAAMESVVEPTEVADEPVEALVGHGTIQVDGESFDVTGDCDVSRDFGLLPVEDPSDPDVDIVLALDNVDDDAGTFSGPWALAITLVDIGSDERVLRGRGGAEGTGEWSGPVAVLELHDRPGPTAAGTATLHVVAEQANGAAELREVVVEVGCRVNGPA